MEHPSRPPSPRLVGEREYDLRRPTVTRIRSDSRSGTGEFLGRSGTRPSRERVRWDSQEREMTPPEIVVIVSVRASIMRSTWFWLSPTSENETRTEATRSAYTAARNSSKPRVHELIQGGLYPAREYGWRTSSSDCDRGRRSGARIVLLAGAGVSRRARSSGGSGCRSRGARPGTYPQRPDRARASTVPGRLEPA